MLLCFGKLIKYNLVVLGSVKEKMSPLINFKMIQHSPFAIGSNSILLI